jgi:malonyl-CoA/methylmalonyl-CoA synthetase
MVPILRKLRKFAAEGLENAVIQSGPDAGLVTLSFKTLLAAVEENAKAIAELLAGAPAELPRHVAFLVNPSLAYVVTELSVWAAGAACVPLSVHSPGPELEYFIENSEAKLLIADEAMASKLAPVAEKFKRSFAKITTVASAEGPPKFQVCGQEGAPQAESGDTSVLLSSHALILYTSGTTGKPKGAVHTFRSVSEQYASLSKAWKWSSKDHTLHVLPLHHIHGVQNILNTGLYNGATVEVCAFDAAFCLKRLCSGDITCFHAVPTIYVKFTQHYEKQDEAARAEIRKGLRNDSMRYMVSGSAALPVPTMQSWAEISGHVLLERYGMTEIGMALSNKIDDTRYPGCVGWPLPRVRVKLQDNAILVKGAAVFKEYYKNEEATKKEFTEDGWFKTGDSAQFGGPDEDLQQMQKDARAVEAATGRPRAETGEAAPESLKSIYKIMGRSSVDIIKSGGYKISALEIESVLLQHEKIKECAVLGKPDETWGEKVTAVCVLEGGDLTVKELREWGKERLATYKVPQELEVVTELPRNQMGKLEKKKLLDRYKK